MNDTNNLNGTGVDNTQVTPPVQENIPVAPQPVTSQPVAAAPAVPQSDVQQSNVEIQEKPATQIEENVDSSSGGAPSAESNNSKGEKLSFPTSSVMLIAFLLLVLAIYLFVIIKPNFMNMYNKLLTTTVDRILGSDSFYNINEENTNFDLTFKLNTDGAGVNANEYLKYLDSFGYNGRFVTNKNDNFHIMLNQNEFDRSDMLQFSKPFTAGIVYKDSKLYFKTKSGDYALVSEESNSDYTKTEAIKYLLHDFINSINLENVTSKVTSVDVNGQTILAVNYLLKLNNEDLNELYQAGLEAASKDEKFIENLTKADVMGLTREELLAKIDALKSVELMTENFEFNYAVNLGFTDMIAFELKIDDVSFKVSSLNGVYYIDYKLGKSNGDFDINTVSKEINGYILLDNEDTYSYLEMISKSNRDSNTYHLLDLDYDFKLYSEESKGSSKRAEKPYMILDFNVDFDYKEDNIDIDKFVFVQNSSDEDKNQIDYVYNKFVYEASYLLSLITSNKKFDNPKDYLNLVMNEFGNPEISKPEVDNSVNENLNNGVISTSTPSE